MNWRSTTVVAPVEINDPTLSESKIATSKWSCFRGDIKTESTKFREEFQRAAGEYHRVNNDFQKTAQKSFHAIHNIRKIKPSGDRCVPKVPHRKKKTVQETFQSVFQFESDENLQVKWPARRSESAQRYLAPSKLQVVYGIQPKSQDIYVVSGEQVTNLDTL